MPISVFNAFDRGSIFAEPINTNCSSIDIYLACKLVFDSPVIILLVFKNSPWADDFNSKMLIFCLIKRERYLLYPACTAMTSVAESELVSIFISAPCCFLLINQFRPVTPGTK